MENKTIEDPSDYETYSNYLNHQMEKTLDPARREIWLGAEWNLKLFGFLYVFNKDYDIISESAPALCLGARTGQEVQALIDMGVDAIGVDLVACEPLVMEGDIHSLEFEDSSFGFVFSNIYDHALYPKKFCSEIERVLRPGGYVLLQHLLGQYGDKYATTFVDDVDSEVVPLFKSVDVIRSGPIHKKWPSYKGRPIFKQMTWELLLRKK